jgi:hypothetical protein
MPSFGAGLADRVGRLGLQRRVRAGDDAVRADLGQPGQAQLLGLGLPHHDDGGRAVGDRRGGPGGDGAVLGERRPQPPQHLDRRVGSDTLVGLVLERVALALRDGDGDNLVVEHAVLPRLGRELVRARGEGVLILPAERILAGVGLVGESAHGLVGEHVPEPS